MADAFVRLRNWPSLPGLLSLLSEKVLLDIDMVFRVFEIIVVFPLTPIIYYIIFLINFNWREIKLN